MAHTSTGAAKVLIADDRQDAGELMEAYLSDSPFETRITTNGEDTLQVVADWHPDLILLDVMMPRLSGFEVCKRLRGDPKTRDVGVLMVTALDQPADVDRAVDAGTDDFLTKPINKAELLLRVNALLQSRGQGQPLARTIDYIRAVQQAHG